jgi:hypothetical protein
VCDKFRVRERQKDSWSSGSRSSSCSMGKSKKKVGRNAINDTRGYSVTSSSSNSISNSISNSNASTAAGGNHATQLFSLSIHNNDNNNNNPTTAVSIVETAASGVLTFRILPPPSTTTTNTSSIHDRIKTLIDQLKQQPMDGSSASTSSSSSSSVLSDRRFYTKLNTIVERLLEVGFVQDHIESAVAMLTTTITYDTALDYLCWYVPTTELPSIFLDATKSIDRNGGWRNSSITTPTTTSKGITRPDIFNENGLTIWGDDDDNPTISTTKNDDPDCTARETTTNDDNDDCRIVTHPISGSGGDGGVVGGREKTKNDEERHVDDDDDGDDDEAERERQKAVVLAMYGGYYESDNDDQAEDTQEQGKEQPTLQQASTSSNTKSNTSTTTPTIMAAFLTPDEIELQQKMIQLDELEADVSNDANNYMRSKYETKQLQQQCKVLRKHIVGLKRKVERQQQQQQKKELQKQMEEDKNDEEENHNASPMPLERQHESINRNNDDGDDADVEDEAEGCNEMFDIFSTARSGTSTKSSSNVDVESAVDGETTTTTVAVAGSTLKKIDCPIPKSWTGTTPQKTLDEMCKNKKKKLVVQRPKYIRLPHNMGYKLVVSGISSSLSSTTKTTLADTTQQQELQGKDNNEWIGLETDFVNGSSIQDYLALQVLYYMDPTLPLHQIFPSAFKDIWLSWLAKVQDVKDQIKNEEEMIRSQRMERLLSIIAASTKTTKAGTAGTDRTSKACAQKTKTSTQIQTTNNEECDDAAVVVEESWDSDVDDDIDAIKNASQLENISMVGIKLQSEFHNRQFTAAYQEMFQHRQNLPMTSYRDQVLDAVNTHPVVILCAETVSGKINRFITVNTTIHSHTSFDCIVGSIPNVAHTRELEKQHNALNIY